MRVLTLSGRGCRIVVSYPSEQDRVFEKVFRWPFGDGACWASIGGNSGSIVKDLANTTG